MYRFKDIGGWAVAGLLSAAFGVLPLSHARATLSLTAAGLADGFTLDTFVTMSPGNSGCCNGPFGVAVSGTHILVGLGSNGTNYEFNDTNNQSISDALNSVADLHSGPYTPASVSVGGVAYGSNSSYNFVQFKSDGSIDHVLSDVTVPAWLGMWPTPDGHIIAATQSGLIEINPTANGGLGSFVTINSQQGDGVSVSPDGKTIYLEQGGNINAYSRSTGAFIKTYFTSGAADGSGVIIGGAYDGDIIANTNYGNIDLIDVTSNTYTTIASGGTRGDYVAPDTTNGSLLLTYSDIVARLSCGTGCSIGSKVPEPMSLALLAVGAMGIAFARRR